MADVLFYAGVAVCIILVVLLCYLYNCGLFHHIEISTGAPYISDVTIAYKFSQGPYDESGRIYCEISKLAPSAKCLGLYYDNPDKVCYVMFFP